jgi:hypothetical protein
MCIIPLNPKDEERGISQLPMETILPILIFIANQQVILSKKWNTD